jgi:hypothetical protein
VRVQYNLFVLSAAMLLSGCGWLNDRAEYEAATGPNAMWYRFTFEAEYQGKPFKIDQMVTCQRGVVSGGSLGQSPNTPVHQGHPKTAAAKMQDGSQILVRIPNMCKTMRAYNVERMKLEYAPYKEATVRYRQGWRSRGPHEMIPFVIWSDSITKPERVEQYVARAYYAHPEARVKNPKGSLDLWPVGKYPENAAAVLKQDDALPFYPHPNINPELGPNSRGRGRDGDYHGKWPKFVTFSIIPVDDPIRAWEKYAQGMIAENESLVDDLATPGIGKPVYEDKNFVVYTRTGPSTVTYPDPNYVSAQCNGSFGVAIGKSLEEDVNSDPRSVGARTPDTEIYNSPNNPKLREEILLKEQNTLHCMKAQDNLRSHEIINGRFDASRSLPGVLVYGKWGPSPYEHKSDTKELERLGMHALVKNKWGNIVKRLKFRIDGMDINGDFALYRDWRLIKNKKTGQWYSFLASSTMFVGEGENSGFNY